MKDITIDDARSILIGCLLEVDNEIVYVMDIDPNGVQNLYHVNSGETYFRKESFDNYKTINKRLGYVNLAGQAIYVYRTTKQQYKFGLHRNNINVKEGLSRTNLWEVVCNDIIALRTKAFLKTFNQEYPTLRESLKMLGDGAEAVAFDRQFAVRRDMVVGYKDTPVGVVRAGKIEWNRGSEHLESVVLKGQL